MAVSTPEGREQSLLTEAEQAALEQQSLLQTARAVEALGDLTSELGGDDSLTPMAESVRDRMAMMSLREQRQFRRSIERASRLLVETSIHDLGHVLPFHDVHEVTANSVAEVTAENPEEVPTHRVGEVAELPQQLAESTAVETDEQAIDDEGNEELLTEVAGGAAEPSVDEPEVETEAADDTEVAFDLDVVAKFYERVNEFAASPESITPDPEDWDATTGIIGLYASENHKKSMRLPMARRLQMVLEGKSIGEIYRQEVLDGTAPESRSAYSNFVSGSGPKFVAKHLGRMIAEAAEAPEQSDEVLDVPVTDPTEERRQAELAAYVEKVVDAAPTLRRAVDPSEQPVELTSGIRMIGDKAPRPERPLEEEPDFVQIAERLTNIIGWDGSYRTAFRALIDPTNRTSVITRSKSEACEMMITALLDSGLKSLEDNDLGLKREQVVQIYRLLGIRMGPNALTYAGRQDMISVYEQVDSTKRNGRTAKVTEISILRGLRTLVEYLESHQSATVR